MNELKSVIESLCPGDTSHDVLHLGRMASGQPLTVPFTVVRGDSMSPCLWVNAAVHGNEIPSSISAVLFARRLRDMRLRGSVVVTPVANPTAVDSRTKHSPYDGVDLDQSFPGREMLLTDRVAERVFEAVAPVASVAVNLHTMSTFMDAARYCVYKTPPDDRVSEKTLLELASCFTPFVVCRMSLGGEGELPGRIAGALDYQMLSLGKPAFMAELGGGGVWDEAMVDEAVESLIRLARVCGVLDPDEVRKPTQLLRVLARTHVTGSEGGFFRGLARPGTRIKAGTVLGQTIDVRGETAQKFRVDDEVAVIGVRRDPLVHPGDRIGFVGLEWDEVVV